MAEARRIITASELEQMSPQERADAVHAGRVASWDGVSDAFKAEILATASELGERRRSQRG
jgi:hypothetical protein